MDDRELEARLKTRLRARFDDAPVPAGLASNLHQAMTTAPVRVAFDLRSRGRWLGWTAVAAAVAIAVVTVTLGTLYTGPATPRATAMPTPAPTSAAWRTFIVLPPGDRPDKPDSTVAEEVLRARLQALGPSNLMSVVGNSIVFSLPADGPSDELVRTVLSASGVVEFVPVPVAAYESFQPEPGDTLPADLPALFGNDGIASAVRSRTEQGIETIELGLTEAAAQLFGDFTAAHQGEYFAIAIDGRIALMPIINEPIRGGSVQIAGGGSAIPGRPNPAFEAAAAILVGGRLPEAWQGASVPTVVTRQFAVNAAMGQFPRATLVSADLDADDAGVRWQAIWSVIVTGDVGGGVVPCPTPGPSGDSCPDPGPNRRVVIDAERGNVIRIEAPERDVPAVP